MSLVSISFYKTYYYFVIVLFLDLLNKLIKDHFDTIYSPEENIKIIELFNLICYNVADLLSGFLVLYTYISSRSDKKETIVKKKSKNVIQYDLIYNDLSIRENKYSFILLISFLEFIGRFSDFFFYLILNINRIRDGEITWLISIDILSRIVFSNLILKSKIYNHHILSIILTILGLCSMSAGAFIIIKDTELSNWPYFISLAIKFVILSLEDVINKLLLTDKFLLPQSLMFLRGLFNSIMFVLFILFIYLMKFMDFSFNINDSKSNIYIQISLIIVYTFFAFLRSFSVIKVIDIFSPQHVSFINVIFYLFRLLNCRINSKDNIALIINDSLCLFIIAFSTLVFNEILIIKICGLDENTKNGFLKKEKKEKEDIILSLNEDEKSEKNME
jgi:hypothetical protein